jgi:hypothetical protein
MTTNETPGPSGTVPDRYLEDISADDLCANAPADETDANRDARRERNRKRNERRRRLRESLPIRNLTEALDQVESRGHTTPEQCFMSITTIAHQVQGMRTGEVITKLAEDSYFMQVDKGSLKFPPLGTTSKTMKPRVVVRTSVATVLERSYQLTPTVLGQQPVDPLLVATAPAATGRSSLIVILAVEATTARTPTTGLAGEPRAEATAAAEPTRTVTSPAPHVAASMPARKLKNYDAGSPQRQATMTASPPSLHGFAICFS